MDAQSAEALVIVAKYPEVGQVKTRLAKHFGDEPACRLYRAFIRDLEATFGNNPRPLYWAYTPPSSHFASVVRAGSRCFPQEGARLSERLLNIFRRLLAAGYQRVVVMGSDAPQMRREWVEEAFTALTHVDTVLAPAEDGGYNLIGMKEAHDVFSYVPMSTAHVLADTLERIRKLGLSVHLLPTSFDVDEIEDVEKLRQLIKQDSGHLIHTREVLRQLEE
ncbi:MAG: TIGR04282 family arsenosugar biosynthesis glycosyltransferase [Acidobacteriota bacterium]|nr:TIGR04282 family arsenosugar biosynthesis glycosyltransferase [Blastocatellia bacterium]MDW8239657.1 TIGR04282 family arsenosugar biosynthesis glycosyltransferase [Acidobacteriota bacterium]